MKKQFGAAILLFIAFVASTILLQSCESNDKHVRAGNISNIFDAIGDSALSVTILNGIERRHNVSKCSEVVVTSVREEPTDNGTIYYRVSYSLYDKEQVKKADFSIVINK